MHNEITLNIAGYHGETVPHKFLQQEVAPGALAVILPGVGYHADLPLLYYPGKIALALGMDVLRLETAYSLRPSFSHALPAEKTVWLDADTDAAVDEALCFRAYHQVTFIGKSLGTRAMGHILERDRNIAATKWIWLTPILNDTRLVTRVQEQHPRSLFVIGTADHFYDQGVLQELVASSSGKSLVIQGADHSLEISGNIYQSIQALQQVMTAIEEFLRE
jgi:hypothetical protein